MVNQLMNTKELAEYVRLKERSVYNLVAMQRIPFTRVTGKVLFPKVLIESWLLDQAEGLPAIASLPHVIAGSHDPLLEWAVRESGSELALLFDASLAGLERLARRRAIGLHVIDSDTKTYNIPQVRARLPREPVVVPGSASPRSRDSSISTSFH